MEREWLSRVSCSITSNWWTCIPECVGIVALQSPFWRNKLVLSILVKFSTYSMCICYYFILRSLKYILQVFSCPKRLEKEKAVQKQIYFKKETWNNIFYWILSIKCKLNSSCGDNHAKIILIFSLAVSIYLCSWSCSKLQNPDDRFNEIGYVLKKGKRTENSFRRCLKTTQQLLGTPSTAFLLKEYSRGNF